MSDALLNEVIIMEKEYIKKARPCQGFNFNTEKEQEFAEGVLYALDHVKVLIKRST